MELRDIKLRGRRAFQGRHLLAALALASCAPRETATVGVSDRSRSVPAPPPRAEDPRAASDVLPENYRKFSQVTPDGFVSRGHAPGRFVAKIFVNEPAAAAMVARSRSVPVGAIAVMEHQEHDGTAGPTMMMEKLPASETPGHRDWRWVTVGARGHVVLDGAPASCTGCHDDSPMDGLFPILPGPSDSSRTRGVDEQSE